MVILIIISTILLCIMFSIWGWLGMHSKRKKAKKIWHDDEYGYDGWNDSENVKLVIGGSGSGKTRFFVKPNLLPKENSH